MRAGLWSLQQTAVRKPQIRSSREEVRCIYRLRAFAVGRCAEEPAPTSSRRSRHDVNTGGG